MQYNRALDGVRALAILAVVSFHCATPWGSGGFLGVDVFFVLSGYLITRLLLEEHRKNGIGIGAFYARRALRLYPTLLLLVIAYLALSINSYLETQALGRFTLGYGRLGPTEARLALIALLTAVALGAEVSFHGLTLLDVTALGAAGAMVLALLARAAGNLRLLAEREPYATS